MAEAAAAEPQVDLTRYIERCVEADGRVQSIKQQLDQLAAEPAGVGDAGGSFAQARGAPPGTEPAAGPGQASASAGVDDRIQRACDLLCVGAKFAGTISIPGIHEGLTPDELGDADEQGPAPYTLEVCAIVQDELDARCIVARHMAYEDEQTCYILLSTTDSRNVVTITYRDHETFCKGLLDLATNRITGQVHQLVQGDEGFEHPSDEHCNVFTLDLVVQSPEQYDLLRQLIKAEHKRVCAVAVWQRKAERVPGTTAAEHVLREVDFIGAIDCASRMSEDLYGVLRQQVAILDALTFTSAAHRQKDFEQLSANGITCARAHHRFDEIAQTIQRLVHAHARCHPLHPVDNPPNSPDHKHIRELIYKFQMRFTLVYRKLHTALRSAEVRVPKDLVKTWIVASVEPGECCTTCMCEVEEEEVVLKLPCKHAFHQECIAKWLHWNTVCPNCRHPMSGEEGKVAEAAGAEAQEDETASAASASSAAAKPE